jgi:hypothetical protein
MLYPSIKTRTGPPPGRGGPRRTSEKSRDPAGLVVLATGLGKSWLAAFDTRPLPRQTRPLRRPPRRDAIRQLTPRRELFSETAAKMDLLAGLIE